MTIRHKDKTGKTWTFEMDCTPVQGRLIERLLKFVYCLGNREELTLSYLAKWEENTAFRNSLEQVVLSALREWNGALKVPPPTLEEPPTIDEPPTFQETATFQEPPTFEELQLFPVQATPPAPTPAPGTTTTPPTFSPAQATGKTRDDDDDGKPHYYWENF